MRVLVTGASGRIGANIVHKLIEGGHRVRAAIRPDTPRKAKLSPFPTEIVEADLRDREALMRAVAGMEAVVHNGVIFTGDPAEMVAGSLEATATLLEAARRNGCARFIFISSTAVYEGTAYRPGDPVREEEAAPEITNVYGACKLGAEALCNAYQRQHGLPCLSLRYPMVTAGAELLEHGFLLEAWHNEAAREKSPEQAAWRKAIQEAWEQGKRLVVPLNADGSAWKRHFCDVRDAAQAVALSLETVEAPGRAYNIASVPIRYDEAATTLAELSGWDIAEIPFPEDYRYHFALDRAAEFLGYVPAFTGPQMIHDAWRARQGQPVENLIAP